MSAKPSATPNFATGGGALLTPPDSPHISNGWLDAELPPAEMFNWLMNNYYQWLQYLNDGHITPNGNDNTWVLVPLASAPSSPSAGGMDMIGSVSPKLQVYDGFQQDKYVPNVYSLNAVEHKVIPSVGSGADTITAFTSKKTVKANSLKVGSTIRLRAAVRVGTVANIDTLGLAIKFGSVTMFDEVTGVTFSSGVMSGGSVFVDMFFTVQTIGGSGTIVGIGDFRYPVSSGTFPQVVSATSTSYPTPVTVATNADFDITISSDLHLSSGTDTNVDSYLDFFTIDIA